MEVGSRGPVRCLELEDEASLFQAATAVARASLPARPTRWRRSDRDQLWVR